MNPAQRVDAHVALGKHQFAVFTEPVLVHLEVAALVAGDVGVVHAVALKQLLAVAGELQHLRQVQVLAGVVDAASAENYDILMGVVYDDNISHLKRIVSNHKVDGVILGRTLINDESIPYLIESKVPFVAIGSTDYKDVVQIDNDHFKACNELTSILIMKGIKKFALIGGDSNHVVNRTRREGFLHALKEQKIDITDDDIFMNCLSDEDVERATDTALRNGDECLMCMDDGICSATIAKLKRDEVSIPEDIKIASFYNSELLSNNQPTITALQYDPKELGINACKTLFDILNGIEVEQKVMLSYEVQLKSSTQ